MCKVSLGGGYIGHLNSGSSQKVGWQFDVDQHSSETANCESCLMESEFYQLWRCLVKGKCHFSVCKSGSTGHCKSIWQDDDEKSTHFSKGQNHWLTRICTTDIIQKLWLLVFFTVCSYIYWDSLVFGKNYFIFSWELLYKGKLLSLVYN